MKKVLVTILLATAFLFVPGFAHAASNTEVANFSQDTLVAFMGLASVATIFFLIRGGYLYITSTGNPAMLEEAKKTIKHALIGLVIIIGAGVLSSLLNWAMTTSSSSPTGAPIDMSPIMPAPADGSFVQIIIDATFGFLRNIITTATKPIFDSIAWFLTDTPSLATNSVVFNFWLTMVGITDSLFVIVIALLGFHVMSASTFGFEELSLKELLPRIALAFVAANTSIFLIDWVISLCQVMIHALINETGGLGKAWIITAFDPAVFLAKDTALVTLIFMVIFILLAVFLIIFYIGRLMLLAFGAAISPLVCLLWLIPKFSDMAASAVSAYLVTIFSLFIHVVLIQLASAFITIPGQSGENPVVSILVGIALFVLLLKSSSTGMYLFLSSQATAVAKAGWHGFLNVMTSKAETAKTGASRGSNGQQH